MEGTFLCKSWVSKESAGVATLLEKTSEGSNNLDWGRSDGTFLVRFPCCDFF